MQLSDTSEILERRKGEGFCAMRIEWTVGGGTAGFAGSSGTSECVRAGGRAVDIVGLIWQSGINQRANILAGSR